VKYYYKHLEKSIVKFTERYIIYSVA